MKNKESKLLVSLPVVQLLHIEIQQASVINCWWFLLNCWFVGSSVIHMYVLRINNNSIFICCFGHSHVRVPPRYSLLAVTRNEHGFFIILFGALEKSILPHESWNNQQHEFFIILLGVLEKSLKPRHWSRTATDLGWFSGEFDLKLFLAIMPRLEGRTFFIILLVTL